MNDIFELKQLNPNMGEFEYEMLQGILNVENGFSNPAYGLTFEDFKSWLVEVDKHSKGECLPEGWIPYTTYILYVNNMPVGYGRIRHSSLEYLDSLIMYVLISLSQLLQYVFSICPHI